jgi:hypothetical protein
MDTMDTGHPANPADKVTEGLHVIKTQMPMVYGAIQDKAEEIGKEAFAIVRKGLRGEPNCFYALSAAAWWARLSATAS